MHTNASLRAKKLKPVSEQDWWQFVGTMMVCAQFKNYASAFKTLAMTPDADKVMDKRRFMKILHHLRATPLVRAARLTLRVLQFRAHPEASVSHRGLRMTTTAWLVILITAPRTSGSRRGADV